MNPDERHEKKVHSLHIERERLKLQEWYIKQIKIGMIEADANANQLVEHPAIVKFWQKKRAAFQNRSANFA